MCTESLHILGPRNKYRKVCDSIGVNKETFHQDEHSYDYKVIIIIINTLVTFCMKSMRNAWPLSQWNVGEGALRALKIGDIQQELQSRHTNTIISHKLFICSMVWE